MNAFPTLLALGIALGLTLFIFGLTDRWLIRMPEMTALGFLIMTCSIALLICYHYK